MVGISSTHGGHHVAQTLTNTTLPRKAASWTDRPCRSGKVKSAKGLPIRDRKSTRLNSSHSQISYAVFCLKKKNTAILEATEFRPVNYKCTPTAEPSSSSLTQGQGCQFNRAPSAPTNISALLSGRTSNQTR